MTSDNYDKRVVIDYAKAIGILAVVVAHYHDVFTTIKPYFYHMPLFFFIGGMLFKPEKRLTDVVKGVATKHWLYIVKNYIIIGLIAVAATKLNNIPRLQYPFKDGVFGTIKFALEGNMHVNGLFLVAWFLVAYSFVSILFAVLSYIAGKFKFINTKFVLLIASLILGAIGFYVTSVEYAESKIFYYNLITQILVGTMFYGFGFSLKDHIYKLLNVYAFIIIYSVILCLVYLGWIAQSFMSWSVYKLGFYNMVITPLLCIYCVFFISAALSKSFSAKLISTVGKNTKSIMSYHLSCFILLDIIFSHFGMWDIKRSSALTHYVDGRFALFYIASALFVPIAFRYGLDKTKAFILKTI